MKLPIKTCLCAFLTICYVYSQAQILDSLIKKGQKLQDRKSREILYLQLDKPSFLLGDTLRFSAYLLDSHYYTPSEKSGIAYIELISPDNGLEKRIAIHLVLGHGFGIIPLDETLVPGYYHIRAYTRWMENFPSSLFFQKDILITGGAGNWSMNITHFSFQKVPGAIDSVHMKFSLKDQYGISLINNLVGINVVNDRNKILLKKTLMTEPDGSLRVHFNLDDKKFKQNVSLQVLDEAQNVRISLPIGDSVKRKTDIQFLPESGHLIAGELNQVAFKAIDENGMGIPVEGVIKDSKGNSVVDFTSTYNGMGDFELIPGRGEKYIAVIENNPLINLPEAQSSGTSIHVDALTSPDKVKITLNFTNDLTGKQYYIIAKSKGLVCYGAKVKNSGRGVKLNIDQKIFPDGICSICLLNAEGQVLNERLFFVDHHNQLNIDIETLPNSPLFTKDSIALKIKATDNQHNPVQGIFSLAVTDDNQVKKDKNADENILSYFLLTSDLKGPVQSPGYYFSDTTIQRKKALDLLMMTQGYVSYNWDSSLKVTPEPEFAITGNVTSLFNKPVHDAKVSLISTGKYFLLKDTLTDDKGNFVFKDFPLFDTASFFVQARSKRGKKFGIGIKLDESDFPPIPNYPPRSSWPVDVNMDTTLQNRIQTLAKYKDSKYGHSQLADVIVKSKASIEESENLNGAGQYDQAFTKEMLERMKDSSLLSILEKNLKGFYVGSCSAKDRMRYYMLNGDKVIFVFDGIRLDQFYDSMDHLGTADPYLDFVSQYLKYYTAKDIKGIEVLSSSKYTDAYLGHYLSSDERMKYDPVMGCPYSFIEITTYGKQGPYMKANSSASVIKPVPFSYGKLFYQPKYVMRKLQDSLPDLRSTIYWHPFFITDKAGVANLYFYSAGQPSVYTLWLEGISLDGKMGLKVEKVKVVDKE